jgi:prephenate dehydrogenase
VVGVTRRAATARRALSLGLVAEAGTDPSLADGADVLVLATPVRTLLRQVPAFAARLAPGGVLTDVGSTKTEVVRAFRALPSPGPALVAGHPMAGNERAGLDGVDPGLFRGRPWVLIPARPADRRRAGGLEGLVRGVGARPLWMADPLDHDRKVADVSHVPHLLAYALMGAPEGSIRVCGGSFRDATRVAASDVDMVLDFLLTNPALAAAAGGLEARLRILVRLLRRKDGPGLRRLLDQARHRRAQIQ